ncbi:MAG: hypothetical protein EPN21_06535 [Methylococcaceae bacterium]|nr:MAG: hypothetical protein EPN21_06535 [Methylococcaceae bacterium]
MKKAFVALAFAFVIGLAGFSGKACEVNPIIPGHTRSITVGLIQENKGSSTEPQKMWPPEEHVEIEGQNELDRKRLKSES